MQRTDGSAAGDGRGDRPGDATGTGHGAGTGEAAGTGHGDGADADFSRFVAGRWRALAHTAYLLTGDFHEAEDLVQATLVKVYPHWRRLRPDTAEQYVRRALVNTNRSRHRRRRVVQLLLPSLPDHCAVENSAGGPGGADGGERDALVRALAALPERQRAVVVLRYWEDLPAEEVAATLRCSVGTVKSQASRALAKLRRNPALAEHAPATGPGPVTGPGPAGGTARALGAVEQGAARSLGRARALGAGGRGAGKGGGG